MNYRKIRKLQEITKVSNRKIAKYLQMSDVGYGKMLDNETCTVATLEAIASFFKKPVSYFFDEKLSNEEKSSIINHGPTSPYIKKCENPDCIKIVKEKDRIINDLRLTNDLLKEKLEEKGEIEPGKKVKGGVEKPREAG